MNVFLVLILAISCDAFDPSQLFDRDQFEDDENDDYGCSDIELELEEAQVGFANCRVELGKIRREKSTQIEQMKRLRKSLMDDKDKYGTIQKANSDLKNQVTFLKIQFLSD